MVATVIVTSVVFVVVVVVTIVVVVVSIDGVVATINGAVVISSIIPVVQVNTASSMLWMEESSYGTEEHTQCGSIGNQCHPSLLCGPSVIPVATILLPQYLHRWVVGIAHWEVTCKLPCCIANVTDRPSL